MNKRNVICLLLIAFSLSLKAVISSQPNFRHHTIQEGLSVNAVYSITQDSKGFLWFGTIDGLNRFDGRHIKTYRLAEEEQQQIRLGSIIYGICEDSNEQLYIA